MAAIRSEGGLLPADVLARIAALDRDLGGLAASDFHLAPNERLGEAIARSWARLTAAWEAFSTDRDGLPVGDHAGRLTRERWLLPLFSELGFGRLIQQAGVEIDGRSYAIFCEYNHSPVHLVGAGVALDRRTAGVRGAADQSPHSVVQELLNRSNERLWGIVTNGLSLRLLRDNVTLTRQAYVEFDLEAIFATEAYEDFALLWLCAHQSRFESETPEDCWLEVWTQVAQRDGTRALGELRSGVERAIEALGRGFLAQPTNSTLRAALRDGGLDGPAYYRELLRLIYRLLFLFVAEDRDALLLPDDGSPERFDARERYESFYATKRLRRLSVRRRGGRAHDLYEQVKLLSGWLYDDGQPVLALPPLGSALWSPETTAHLSDARLGNEALLEAIRELAYVEGGRRPVDFRNLGAEELGSVYESLLELHPQIDRETASFTLTTAAGHERKQTGSYYTPTSLIGSLLETALDPVLDDAVRHDDPEQALLDLTLCDPACGSGHFLIAAANRIAKRLAAVREHDPEPAPEAIRHALRDVVSRCIHGVDVNPMAVELCKVSLWMEALDPGRPLSFLDDRIACGNSLVGATPELVAEGLPPDAFKPLLGDDKDVVTELRKRNARELKGQMALDVAAATTEADLRALAQRSVAIAGIDDSSLRGVHERERRFRELERSPELERARLLADTWCAAFVAPKRTGATPITQETVHRVADHGLAGLSVAEVALVNRLRDLYSFHHWHVAFPAVFAKGGFDVVVGNPPWERVKLQEKEFFAARVPAIAAASNKAARERLITALAEDEPALFAAFQDAKRRAEGESHILRSSGRYPLCGRGDVNTYAVFAEAMRTIIQGRGRVGVIVPTGIATDDTTKHFFRDLVEKRALVFLYSFENEEFVFPQVHHDTKFCLLTLVGKPYADDPQFVFFARQVADLSDEWRRFTLSAEDVQRVNPNTGTCPTFRSRRDAEITKRIYEKVSPLVHDGHEHGNPWGVRFARMFDMANDSGLFHEAASDDRWPLYEGKMFWQFDHRFGTYEGQTEAQSNQGKLPEVSDQNHRNPGYAVRPNYWISTDAVQTEIAAKQLGSWLIACRKIAPTTNARTMVFAALPAAAVGDSAQVVSMPGASPLERLALIACMNSFAADYVCRQKMSGKNLNFFVLKQVAIPSPSMLRESPTWAPGEPYLGFLAARAMELSYTAHDLDAIREDEPGCAGPFRWDLSRRAVIRAELDAAIFHLYGLGRVDVDHIMSTFPVAEAYEVAEHGEFRQRRMILERYDAMALAGVSGGSYETVLDPPPADPRAAHGVSVG